MGVLRCIVEAPRRPEFIFVQCPCIVVVRLTIDVGEVPDMWIDLAGTYLPRLHIASELL